MDPRPLEREVVAATARGPGRRARVAARGAGWGTAARWDWTAEGSGPPREATVAAPGAPEVAEVGAAEAAGLTVRAGRSVAG